MRRGWLLTFVTLAGCDAIFDLEKVDYTPPPPTPPCEPLDVDTGRHHTCAVDYRGEVRCWGENFQGEVLPGAAGTVLLPLQVVLPGPAAQVATGKHHSCARLDDGSVWCWGENEENQLALGVDVDGDAPVAIAGLPPSAEISAGGYHTCSRSTADGSVWCWGSNQKGESGQTTNALDCEPNTTDVDACQMPTAVPSLTGTKALALGHGYSCVINAEDRVVCWGNNNARQLTLDPDATEFSATPMLIAQIGSATHIAAAGRTVCAVEMNGTVKCWGAGSEGQLGTGAFTSEPSSPVGTLVENARSIAVGNFGACAVLRDGTVSCWGNTDGGAGGYVTSPSPLPAMVTDVRRLSSKYFHTCAIAAGDVSCWGLNADAQLGRGTQSIAKTPVTPIASGAREIAAGRNHVCAIANDKLYCWGDNDWGQAGDPTLARTYVPTERATGIPLAGLAAGYNQTCVWGGSVAECWGQAWTGRLGTGVDQRTQERTMTLAMNVDHVTVGANHMCALLTNNSIQCFGYNSQGQVGINPSSSDRSMTGNIVTNPSGNALGTIAEVVAGSSHNCARTSTGVWCWGRGDEGQLGDGSTSDRFVPVQVPGLNATDIALGENHTCAINAVDGEPYCWGRNGNGQIGNNSGTAQFATRQKVLGLPPGVDAEELFSGPGTSSTCARLVGGAVYCWGDGDFAQLGNGLLSDMRQASLAAPYMNATALAMSSVGSCAIVNGAVNCVGDYRVLGNDDRTLSVPTPVNLGIGTCPL